MPDGENQTAWTESLPAEIRGHEAWKDIPDVSTLANKYVGTLKPFAEQLPEDIRADAVFKDIKDLNGLAKGYKSAQQMIGIPKDQLLRLPVEGDEASEKEYRTKIGVPEKPDGYKINFPEGAKVDADFVKGFQEAGHKAGVTPKQAQQIVDWYTSDQAKRGESAGASTAAEAAERVGKLKTEWGAAFDQKVAGAKKAVEHFEAKYPGLKDALERTGLGNEPAFAKFFDGMAANLREDGLLGRADGSAEQIESPVEARQQIAALQQDKNFMKSYQDRRDVGHKAAVGKMEALYQRAYPPVRAA